MNDKLIKSLKVGDTIEWYNGPLTFKEKIIKLKDGMLAVPGAFGNSIPLSAIRSEIFKSKS